MLTNLTFYLLFPNSLLNLLNCLKLFIHTLTFPQAFVPMGKWNVAHRQASAIHLTLTVVMEYWTALLEKMRLTVV